MSEWKTIRVTKEAWKNLKKAIAGFEVDLDDFASFVIESAPLPQILEDYLHTLEEEEEEEGESEEQ